MKNLMQKQEITVINLTNKNMNILTRKSFEHGCQFQTKGSSPKGQLYISQINSQGLLALLDYAFACEYGKDIWLNISEVIFTTDLYFVFEYKILGEKVTVKQYFDEYEIVNYKKNIR